MKVQVDEVRRLIGNSPSETIAAIEALTKECLSARALRELKRILTKIRRDASLPVELRDKVHSLWRAFCRSRNNIPARPNNGQEGTTPAPARRYATNSSGQWCNKNCERRGGSLKHNDDAFLELLQDTEDADVSTGAEPRE